MFRELALLVVIGLTLAACSARPSEQDLNRLDQLEEEFGNRYDFSFESDLYLRAQATSEASLSEQEARAIYRAFWMENGSRRADTHYVYLNVYDRRGRFAFQIAWDPQRQQVVRSSTEHY